MDAGHDVHQVSDEVKNQVPEHIRKAAREMNRKAYNERLREIQMSEHDAAMYEQFSSQVFLNTHHLHSTLKTFIFIHSSYVGTHLIFMLNFSGAETSSSFENDNKWSSGQSKR